MAEEKYISKCCGAEAKTETSPDFVGSAEGCTMNMICSKCKKVCDVHLLPLENKKKARREQKNKEFKLVNEKHFEYTSRYGTEFRADRCDFRNGISVKIPKDLRKDKLVSDVAEMVADHTLNIRPQLNEFSGYDCIRFFIRH